VRGLVLLALPLSLVVLASVGCGTDERRETPVRVRVPEVVGWGEVDAINRVVKAKLCVSDISYVAGQPVSPSLVIEQRPKAGALVRPGLRTKLFVSVGNGTGIGAGINVMYLGGGETHGECPPTRHQFAAPPP